MDTKLPLHHFQVLDEEWSRLKGTPSTFAAEVTAGTLWDFDPTQLKGPDLAETERQLSERLKRLCAEVPGASENMPLVDRLNRLLRSKESLTKHRSHLRVRSHPHLESLLQLQVPHDSDDRVQLNRLVLEGAFPQYLRKISDVRLARFYERLHAGEAPAALCLSGGGIRSATFALGLVQGLARRGVIKCFDYLSTVSGGGYIGSWLSAWIHHSRSADSVFNALSRRKEGSPLDPEPAPLRNLRRYSNYLTPKTGLLSADTWSFFGTYLNNLLLNWVVFIPLLMAVLAVPRLQVSLLHWSAPRWLMGAALGIGLSLAILATAFAHLNRPARARRCLPRGSFWDRRRGQGSFIGWCLLPLWLSSLLLTTFWGWLQNLDNRFAATFSVKLTGISAPYYPNYLAIGLIVSVGGVLLASLFSRRWMLRELGFHVVAGAVGGTLLFVLAKTAMNHVHFHSDFGTPALLEDYLKEHTLINVLYACLAAPAFLGTFLVGAACFVGFTSRIMTDADREWTGRMGAWVLITMVVWGGFGLAGLATPLLFFKAYGWIVSLAGAGSGGLTLFLGQCAGTPAKETEASKTDWGTVLRQKALGLAAPLFILFLGAVLSLASGWIIKRSGACPLFVAPWKDSIDAFSRDGYLTVLNATSPSLAFAFLGSAAALGLLASLFIDINKFSMHGLYRNRLVRAYLGASNVHRSPNPFTGFDPFDNLAMSTLRDPADASRPQRPLHVVNVALNLVGGDNMAWQERKAESFTISPLHSGSFRLGYRRSNEYASKYNPGGITLGTAVAISGAAASPNMGYHSSPVIAALLSFFNVRLGWWLGNPGAAGQSTYPMSAPGSGVWYFLKEALGLTDSSSRYVYLSDGGHFENLGLYEMVFRRCRTIVLSDAGCDPTCSLEDLGNAIRKIRVDLGVDITIKDFYICSRTDESGRKDGKYVAIGEIDYERADGKDPNRPKKGVLLYIKPAIYGCEPKDVYNYQRNSAEFPHESTADQWFSESQFESYRALGEHIVNTLASLQVALPRDGAGIAPELADFMARSVEHTRLEIPAAVGGSSKGS